MAWRCCFAFSLSYWIWPHCWLYIDHIDLFFYQRNSAFAQVLKSASSSMPNLVHSSDFKVFFFCKYSFLVKQGTPLYWLCDVLKINERKMYTSLASFYCTIQEFPSQKFKMTTACRGVLNSGMVRCAGFVIFATRYSRTPSNHASGANH